MKNISKSNLSNFRTRMAIPTSPSSSTSTNFYRNYDKLCDIKEKLN